MKLPRSPIAARSADQPGKGYTPPQAHAAPPVDTVVQPRPRGDRSPEQPRQHTTLRVPPDTQHSPAGGTPPRANQQAPQRQPPPKAEQPAPQPAAGPAAAGPSKDDNKNKGQGKGQEKGSAKGKGRGK